MRALALGSKSDRPHGALRPLGALAARKARSRPPKASGGGAQAAAWAAP